MTAIEADYLVIGTGAAAMAFVDTLLSERPDAVVAMADRHHRPGGHWNDAYPFVRLHQPAHWYGVGSREFIGDVKDTVGFNAGHYALASGAEVLAYYDQVMQQRFLPSGRVRWLPMSEYGAGPDGGHRVTSLISGAAQEVRVRRKLVDARHARTEVPSTRPPAYRSSGGVCCLPVNQLPSITRPYAAYTVVGSGKTGIDACLWLLENDVPPERIRWIMPRDAWLLDRANFQPGPENFERNMARTANQFDAIVEAGSVDDLFARLEALGLLMRIDPGVTPRTYRCATASRGELAQLRRIRDIVRMGRLQAVEPTRLVLEQGTLPADPDTLYVDCSASAIRTPPNLSVFDGDTVNLLAVRTCQPVFSAALIAYVESHFGDDAEKNALCSVVPTPEHPVDWLRMWLVTLVNAARWRQNPALNAWLTQSRLNMTGVMMRGVDFEDPAHAARMQANALKSAASVPKLLGLLAGKA
ncbi:MAG: hypothetical protein ABW032_02130 [Burkholderiaceae bacterium]